MTLEPIHDRAIDLILAGKRQYEIALELNVSARTLRRWNKVEAFREELETQRNGARNIAQTVMAIAAEEQAAFARNAMDEAFKLLKSDDTKLQLQAIALSMKMMQQQRRQESNEKWREFVYFDKLERKEAEKKQEPESELAAELSPVPQAPVAAPESGQDRPKADTTAQPAAEPATESGQNRPKADTVEAPETPIVVKEAKFTGAPRKPNFQASNKTPFYAGVARRR